MSQHRYPTPPQIAQIVGSAWCADLKRRGGLARALRAVMTDLGVHLTLNGDVEAPGLFSAGVKSGERSSGVTCQNCGFLAGFRQQGVEYGTGWARELVDIGRAIVAFQVETASVSEMAARFNWFVPNEFACSHEQGAAAFVDARWRDLEGWLRSDENYLHEKLLPLFLETAKRPKLRQLLPFSSLYFLGFSRTTGYPFSRDCPIAFCREASLFIVMCSDQKTILGEGEAAQAADIIVAKLPPNCGPAIHGTAERLKQ